MMGHNKDSSLQWMGHLIISMSHSPFSEIFDSTKLKPINAQSKTWIRWSPLKAQLQAKNPQNGWCIPKTIDSHGQRRRLKNKWDHTIMPLHPKWEMRSSDYTIRSKMTQGRVNNRVDMANKMIKSPGFCGLKIDWK